MGVRPTHLAAFDFETTGPDPEVDAIVSAFVGLYDIAADTFVEQHDWLLHPRIPISDGAAAVHGIEQATAVQWGDDAAEAVFKIAQRLDIYGRGGHPIVGYNLRFDITMLDREAERYYPGIRVGPFKPVLDGYVLDKHLNPYRKGKRTLEVVAKHHGIPATGAHDAGADCLMAARLVKRQIATIELARYSPAQLHEAQIKWAAEQARGLAAYFRKTGKADVAAGVQEAWPLVPKKGESA